MKNESGKIERKIFRFLILPFCFLLLASLNFGQTLAPGAPGKDAQWATAGKQGVGTSANLESKVWFTLAQGVMTEVYYPDVTVANVHLLQFVVVNPKTKKVETEQDDAIHEVKVLKPDSLTFQQINTAKSGEWTIRKTYVTHASGNSVWINVEFETKSKDLHLYVFYDPSLKNSGMHDIATVMRLGKQVVSTTFDSESNKTNEKIVSETDSGALLWASEENITSLLLFDVETTNATSGYFGTSDGLAQLREKGSLKETYDFAKDGNVVQMARIVNPKKFTTILAFGKDFAEALKQINPTRDTDTFEKLTFEIVRAKYEKGWSDYVKTLPKVEAKYQAQFNMAAMILKAHEDKTKRGANIASLTVPWGGGSNANENNIGGYHLIWSRDLYQVATAFVALGDTDTANRALDFLFKVQQKPDGSFPQNSYLDGKPFWGSLQMDEVAYPLIMAYQVGRFDKATWENHVKKAADFIVKNGPATPQERWEEEAGYSPSTIAAEIAGLVCAAEIAKKNGDAESANLYLKTADEWQANIEKWTVTTNGKYGDGNYYLRITQNGKPDAGEKIELNNGAGTFDEREIVDAGFLELVRLGIKSPDDPLIAKSLKVIDEVIRVKTPNGDAFYRYNHDGYGEMDDGRRWNFDGKYTGKGRLWALLSGERGQYELALNEFKNRKSDSTNEVNQNTRLATGLPVNAKESGKPVAKRSVDLSNNELSLAKSRLDSMLAFANDGLMIPEQIWDSPNVPKNADKQFVPELKFGEGTGSATPLAWSMAQFIRLAVNLQAGKNLDTPDVVYNRYVLGKKNALQTNINAVPITGLPINNRSISELLNLKPYQVNYDCYNNWAIRQSTSAFGISERTKKGANIELWQCSENKTTAIVFYKGIAEKIEIVGDFTNWKPQNLRLKEFFVPRDISDKERLFYIPLEFSNSARVEYKLIVDGKWINDPLNPNKVDNGVSDENSFFTMPDYQPTVWDKGETPQLETVEIDSKTYGKRTIQVYVPKPEPFAVADGLTRQSENSKANKNASNKSNSSDNKLKPPATADGSDLATVYLQDGNDYVNRAKAIQIQQNLVKVGKTKPFIMVFIDPKDRMKEYWANDDYAKFVAEEVVPAIDAKYKTIKSRDGRAIMGASLGGITSFHTAIKYPEIFGRVGGQSSSFLIDNERVVKELETLDASKNKFTFYIDDGSLEGVEDSGKVVKMLKDKGFDVTYNEAEAGHNWTAWRDRLAEAFIAIWK